MFRRIILGVMLVSMLGTIGCGQMGTGTGLGAMFGGAAGGVLAQFVDNDIVKAAAPAVGAGIGGGIGYIYDQNNQQQMIVGAKGKLMKSNNLQSFDYILQVRTMLIKSNGTAVIVRNGQELGSNLATIQPGQQFTLEVSTKNVNTFKQNMEKNGYVLPLKSAQTPKGTTQFLYSKLHDITSAGTTIDQLRNQL